MDDSISNHNCCIIGFSLLVTRRPPRRFSNYPTSPRKPPTCSYSSESRRLCIGIVGAGAAGLYLANLLSQTSNHHITVFEKAPVPRLGGYGIVLPASGMRALYHGSSYIFEAVRKAGVPITEMQFFTLPGDLRTEVDRSEELSGQFFSVLVHRQDILHALLGKLPAQCIRTGACLLSVKQDQGCVTATFANGETWEGHVLIGADGMFSAVRRYVCPGYSPLYLGDAVWRGVAKDCELCTNGFFISYRRDEGIHVSLYDLGRERTHWGVFIEKEQAPDEIGKARPNNVALSVEDLSRLPELVRRLIGNTPAEGVSCRFSYHIRPLPTFRRGRVLLIGDASHAMAPTQAQGMASAFEDALSLAKNFENCCSNSVEEILASFEAERLQITHQLQIDSLRISDQRRSAKSR